MNSPTLLLTVAGFVTVVSCGGGDGRRDTAAAPGAVRTTSGGIDLNGAGATFPFPIYQKWFHDYAERTGIKINYQSIGSGGGVRQVMEQTVDFGASDGPMTDEELSRAKGGPIMHFPTVLGAVVVTYNVPELSQPLRITGPVISDIYMGRIRKWNDPRLASLNPTVSLPASDILVVHRSDGSGTTYVFTDYLAAVSPEWARAVGRSKEVRWPAGIGAKGNEGVAGQVKSTPGSIGYVELAYAKQNRLPHAHVQNVSGRFVEASIASVTAAAEGVTLTPDTDYRLSVVNAPGPNAYPISSFTWLLVYRHQTDSVKGRKLKDFLRWAYTEGEASAAALDYAPLPATMTQRLIARLDSIRVGGGS